MKEDLLLQVKNKKVFCIYGPWGKKDHSIIINPKIHKTFNHLIASI